MKNVVKSIPIYNWAVEREKILKPIGDYEKKLTN